MAGTKKAHQNEKDNHLNFNMLIFQGVKFPLLDMPWVGKRQAEKKMEEKKPARRPPCSQHQCSGDSIDLLAGGFNPFEKY